MSEPREIILLSSAHRALAEARTLDEIKDLRDKAVAVKAYAKKAQLGKHLVVDASTIKLRAERKLGELLHEIELVNSAPGNQHTGPAEPSSPIDSNSVSLADLGISKSDSSRSQRIATLPEDEFERYVTENVEQATYWQDALDKLVTPVDRAIAEDKGVFRTVDQHLTELTKVSEEVINAANSLTRGILEAERLASESSNLAPGDGTLAQAIKAHKQAKAKAIIDAILAASAGARKKAEGEAMRIAEAEEAKRYAVETLVQQEETANDRRQLEIKLENDRAKGERLIADLARAKLLNEYERELPEIKSLLRPFITPALAQINGRYFERSAVPVPMSLARIQGSGALKEGVGGLSHLSSLGGSSSNGRTDIGGFPKYSPSGIKGSDHVLTTVKRAQDLLIKYGDLLVEKELLRE